MMDQMGHMMSQLMPQMGGGMSWTVFFGTLGVLVFFGAIVGLVAGIVLRFTGPKNTDTDTSALHIARERFARGDLTREQYEDVRQTLEIPNATKLRAA